MLDFVKTKFRNQIIRLREYYLKYYKLPKLRRSTIHDFDLNIFKNKRIAIIGSADSALQHKLGEYIDSFDLVVRINKGINQCDTYGEYLGYRTDILFSGLDEHPLTGCGIINCKDWSERGVQRVYYTFNEPTFFHFLDNFLLKNNNVLPLYQVSRSQYLELRQRYDIYPTTGFSALYHILQSEFKELYISGFTFFKSPHQSGYNKNLSITANAMEFAKSTGHDPEKEFIAFRELYNEKKFSKAITLDDRLVELFC